MMAGLPYAQTLVIMFVLMLALTALARRLNIPYPILLVLGGLALGFIPRLTALQLAPDLVFLVFLPPILWAAAYFTSLREFRRNLRPISLLAIGLVLATTAAVAIVIHALIPAMSWAAAFALGAIVSPPDAVAATAIGHTLPIPRRVVVILEGESLVNDASALVLYRSAVVAAVTGEFILSHALMEFVYAAIGGVLVGIVIGMVTRWALRLLDDGFTEIAVTLIAPYAAWVLAEQLHTSAVLACVAGGIYVRWHYSAITAPATRLQARAVWEQLIFLLNGLIFILIGLQLGSLRAAIPDDRFGAVVWQAMLVSLTAIVVRLVWVPLAAVVPRWLLRSVRDADPMPPKQAMFLISWTGMRGVVSLASALALPLTIADGSPFPYRAEIILITFGVILATLVLQGLSLAPIVKLLGFAPEHELEREEKHARRTASAAALDRIADLGQESWTNSEHLDRLRTLYEQRQRRLTEVDGADGECTPQDTIAYRRARQEALAAERQAVLELRNRGVISDDVLHRLEYEFDVEALRIGTGNERIPATSGA